MSNAALRIQTQGHYRKKKKPQMLNPNSQHKCKKRYTNNRSERQWMRTMKRADYYCQRTAYTCGRGKVQQNWHVRPGCQTAVEHSDLDRAQYSGYGGLFAFNDSVAHSMDPFSQWRQQGTNTGVAHNITLITGPLLLWTSYHT